MKRTPFKRKAWKKPVKRVKKVSKKRVKLPTLGKLQRTADALLQQINSQRHERCFLCNNPNQVGHHFFPKSVSSALRYSLSNIINLCNGCHMRLHQSGDPSYEQRILFLKGADWYKELEIHARDYLKVDRAYYLSVIDGLNKELESYSIG